MHEVAWADTAIDGLAELCLHYAEHWAEINSAVDIIVTVHGAVKNATKIPFTKEGRKAGRNRQFNSCFPAFLSIFVLSFFVRVLSGYISSNTACDDPRWNTVGRFPKDFGESISPLSRFVSRLVHLI